MSPPSISMTLVTIRFMKSRSWEVISRVEDTVFRKVSSHRMDSMSRWLVGSSSSSTSNLPSSTLAMATRIFQPPDRAPTSPSIWSSSKPRPARQARARASSS